jgi:hypothetical protein
VTTPHDALFKETLRAFLPEFVALFYPEVAARLDFARGVEFLDKETFTDIPDGARREADLVARVHTVDGAPELLLVHVEVQSARRGEFAFRMFEYYALLRLRHRLPVFPVVVYLAPGAGGLVEEEYAEELFGTRLLTFRYKAVGLPDLPADDYVTRADNPLGPALSALMRGAGMGRARRKATGLSNSALRLVDEARRSLLVEIIERYLTLTPAEAAEFERLIGTPEYEEASEVITTYEARGLERGREQGIAQGIAQGIEEGTVRTKRDDLLRLARRKFSAVSDEFAARIGEMADIALLDALLDRVLTANTREEFEAGLPAR